MRIGIGSSSQDHAALVSAPASLRGASLRGGIPANLRPDGETRLDGLDRDRFRATN